MNRDTRGRFATYDATYTTTPERPAPEPDMDFGEEPEQIAAFDAYEAERVRAAWRRLALIGGVFALLVLLAWGTA